MKLDTISTLYRTTNMFKVAKINSSSGISRSISKIKNLFSLNFHYKKLRVTNKSHAGRNNTGQKTLRTRGSRSVKQTRTVVNYRFREKYISLIGGFFMVPFFNKLLSLVFLSSGSVTYITSTTKHELFQLIKMYPNSKFLSNKYLLLKSINPRIIISQGFYLVSQLSKNKPISLIELTPEKGIQYVRSTGCKGTIIKMDLRLQTSIIKLPSGVRKIFSTSSIGSEGSVALTINKDTKNTKAGFKKNFGFKSIVRGVAMNPTDHPHGGRAKAIRYQRTPWGKTTKYK